MANPDHIRILKQGVTAWNEWRQTHPDIVPDLREAKFGAFRMEGYDLSHCDMRNMRIDSCFLGNLNLSSANLQGVGINNTVLSNINLTDADMSRINIRGSILNGVNMDGADLREAVFVSLVIEKMTMSVFQFK